MGVHKIGQWDFDPGSGELILGGQRRRLEPRAARTLELLCEAAGAVVPHDAIIADVWGGRSLSDNSVSIVVGQLRRMLGDDGRSLIETVPKRGYRLNPQPDAATPAARRSRAIWWIVLVTALAVAAIVVMSRQAGQPVIAVADVINATGDRAFDAHARATSELLVNDLGQRGYAVVRGRAPGATVLQPRLVMWNGAPFLGLTATGPDGVVRWSAMMPGAPGEIPVNLAAELDRFKAGRPAR